MRKFFSKRLPALLLALILTAGVMPAAVAADCTGEHSWDSGTVTEAATCTKTGTMTYHCTVDGCTATKTEPIPMADHEYQVDAEKSTPATCSATGKTVYVCKNCQDTKTVTIDKTAHSWGSWTTLSESTCTVKGEKERECSICHTSEKQNLDLAAHQYDDNSIQVTKAPTCTASGTRTYTCTVCHQITKTETISATGHTYVNGKCTVCGVSQTTNYEVTFKTGSATITESVATGSKPAMSKVPSAPTMSATNKTYAFKGWIKGTTSSYIYTNQTLVTPTSESITGNTTFSAVYTVKATNQNSSLAVDGDSDGYTISGLRAAINTLFSGTVGSNFTSVKLTSLSSSTYGKLYTSSSKNSTVSTSTSYSYSEAANFYFVPTTQSTFSVVYTATDSTGANTVSGTITLNVSASTSGSTIKYSVSAGNSVAFKKADFQSAYRESYSSGTITYVELSTTASISTSNGTVYYNYNGSGEKAFTKSNIDNYHFYYSSSSYGDYSLASLSYVAPKSASEQIVRLSYKACYSSSKYVEGTVEIRVSETSSSTITYSVDAGESVAFKKSDFKSAYDDELDGTIRYITLSTSDTLSTSVGTVYYDYDSSSEKAFTKSNIDDYKYYYSSSSYGDYSLTGLSYVAPDDADERTVELAFRVYDSNDDYVSGTVEIEVGGGSGSSDTITYKVDAGESVAFKKSDFKSVYDDELDGTIRYITLSTSDTLSTSVGTVYYNYDGSGEKAFTKSNIDDYKYYYSSSSYGDYSLADLSYVAPSGASKQTVELDFRVYDSNGDYVSGTVKIVVSGSSSSSGNITYQVEPGKTYAFGRSDFNDYYQEKKDSSNTIRWVTFSTSDTLNTSNGTVYYNYGSSGEKALTKSTLDDYNFYYSSTTYGDYPLSGLSFVAGSSFTSAVELDFRAYYSSSSYVDGTLVISPKATTTVSGNYQGDIVYYSTYNSTVQIKSSDIQRFFHSKYSSSTLQSVVLGGVPSTGSLYYNYFGVSKNGASKLKLTSSNYAQYTFYASPSSTSQYALTELLYVPSSSNYCVSIPFTASGSNSKSASGTILISVNLSTVGEVYGVTPKNTAVSLPASSIYSAVSSATGTNLSSIQLLSLPASSVGTLYVGSGTSTKATTSTLYGYSTGTYQMSQLRFVPASGYTGSVEIPYVACNSSGTAIASGKFCLGVVSAAKKFSDVSSSTWCYKYVVELADGSVIDGYTDGSFKPNNTITYGAALKLVMLAAGYAEQAPTGSGVFSGYLAKARSEGIVTRSNVDLSQPITRLQVAQLAAGALKLDTTNLSTSQPFTDTTDASVQALNAAGIVEGYFSGGTSTYKPNNTLTRGQVSAIVWRMRNYSK